MLHKIQLMVDGRRATMEEVQQALKENQEQKSLKVGDDAVVFFKAQIDAIGEDTATLDGMTVPGQYVFKPELDRIALQDLNIGSVFNIVQSFEVAAIDVDSTPYQVKFKNEEDNTKHAWLNKEEMEALLERQIVVYA